MTAAVVLHCECGEKLVGRQTRWCTQCAIKQDAGSSQCPYCFAWYFTHSGRKGDMGTMELHAKGRCIRG